MSNNLDVNRIVNVSISAQQPALQAAGFGVLNIVGNSDTIPLGERTRAYNSIDDVAAEFSTDSEEYKAAAIFFSQSPRPQELYISRRADVDQPAQLLCGANPTSTIATWKAVTSGGFTVGLGADSLGEELVTNGTFESATAWSLEGAYVSGGKLIMPYAGSAQQTISGLVNGNTYRLTVTHIADSGVTGQLTLDGPFGVVSLGTNGSAVSRDFVCVDSSRDLAFGAGGYWKGTIDDVSLKLVTPGEEDVLSLDFSAVQTLADVASVISTGFSGGSCEYDSLNNRFILETTATGADATITFLTAPPSGTDISGMMDGLYTDGGSVQAGADAETVTESLTAIENLDGSWYGLAFTNEINDSFADVMLAAAWCEARTKLFCNTSSDGNTKISGNTSSVAYALSAAEYNNTFTVFNEGDYAAISVFARGASVNFDADDATITYMFKKLPGITASNLSPTQANALEAVNCNYYARFGTKLSGDAVAMTFDGRVASGRFIDEIVNLAWLQNRIQTDAFNVVYQSTTKVPQTNEGVGIIASAVESVLQVAVRNGMAAPGEITTNEGTVYLEKGYEVFAGNVDDQSQADREARKAPPITFALKGAGAIHSVTILGNFIR